MVALDDLRRRLRPNPSWYALLAALLLTALGITALDTVPLAPHETDWAAKQGTLWLPAALVVMVLCLVPLPRVLQAAAYPLMWLLILVLVYLLIPSAPLVPRPNGARSWIDIPGLMRVQPSEPAKVIFVLALASYLRYRASYRTLRGLLIPFGIMLLPVALILKQPDLGTALVFAPALFAMLVAAGARLRHLGGLLAVATTAVLLVVVVTLWAPDSVQILKPHQQRRIVSMVSLAQGDTRHLQKDAYQQNVAMRLIAAGGVAGYGKQRASDLIRENALPEDHNDSIFAVIVNRWGLVGAWATLALYTMLIGSILAVAARTKDPFARLACVGFAAVFFTQSSIHIGMHVGLLPITGITLPFVSYGGSSLLTTFAMVGLTLNFAGRRPVMLTRPSFEFDRRADTAVQWSP